MLTTMVENWPGYRDGIMGPDLMNEMRAQAEGFGPETIRLLAWMQTQAKLVPLIENNKRQVLAGAHRLNARYLLDGNRPGPALKAYRQALK